MTISAQEAIEEAIAWAELTPLAGAPDGSRTRPLGGVTVSPTVVIANAQQAQAWATIAIAISAEGAAS